jgi:hypothetical protein
LLPCFVRGESDGLPRQQPPPARRRSSSHPTTVEIEPGRLTIGNEVFLAARASIPAVVGTSARVPRRVASHGLALCNGHTSWAGRGSANSEPCTASGAPVCHSEDVTPCCDVTRWSEGPASFQPGMTGPTSSRSERWRFLRMTVRHLNPLRRSRCTGRLPTTRLNGCEPGSALKFGRERSEAGPAGMPDPWKLSGPEGPPALRARDGAPGPQGPAGRQAPQGLQGTPGLLFIDRAHQGGRHRGPRIAHGSRCSPGGGRARSSLESA